MQIISTYVYLLNIDSIVQVVWRLLTSQIAIFVYAGLLILFMLIILFLMIGNEVKRVNVSSIQESINEELID